MGGGREEGGGEGCRREEKAVGGGEESRGRRGEGARKLRNSEVKLMWVGGMRGLP